MSLFYICFFIFVLVIPSSYGHSEEFKYECDILVRLDSLETKQTETEEKIAKCDAKLTETERKLTETDAKLTDTEKKLNDTATELKEAIETITNQLRDATIKPTVAFQAKDVHTASPAQNTTLRFTDVILNTDDVYDPSSGNFTAPVDGTYFFAVQACIYNMKFVQVTILAEDVVLNTAIFHDITGNAPCSTVIALSVLTQGSHVYVQRGHSGSPGTVLFDNARSGRWITFMGSLVN